MVWRRRASLEDHVNDPCGIASQSKIYDGCSRRFYILHICLIILTEYFYYGYRFALTLSMISVLIAGLKFWALHQIFTLWELEHEFSYILRIIFPHISQERIQTVSFYTSLHSKLPCKSIWPLKNRYKYLFVLYSFVFANYLYIYNLSSFFKFFDNSISALSLSWETRIHRLHLIQNVKFTTKVLSAK